MFKMGRDAFATAMIAPCRQEGLAEELAYEQEQFCLRTSGERDLVFNLGNAYAEYCSRPIWNRRQSIINHARATVGAFADGEIEGIEQAAPLLRARVRSRMYHEYMRLDALAEGQTPFENATRPLGEHLTIDVCLDRQRSMHLVGADQLAKWNYTFDDALAIGLDNLKAASRREFRRVQSGVYVSQWDDGYDASRILITNLFDGLAIKGRPVVMLPNVNTLLVTGDADEAGLLAMAKYSQKIPAGPRPLSLRAFRLNATWEPYVPDRGHPAYGVITELEVQDRLSEYSDQQEVLKRLYASRNEDTFVASFLASRDNKSREITTRTTWGKPCDSHIPQVDQIAFVDMSGDGEGEFLGMVPWDKVTAIVSDLMVREDMYPPRFHVTEFPSPEQLLAMDVCAGMPSTAN